MGGKRVMRKEKKVEKRVSKHKDSLSGLIFVLVCKLHKQNQNQLVIK